MPIIKLVSAAPGWWDNLNAKQRQAYIEKHPNSRYGAQGKAPPTKHKPRKPITLKQAQKKRIQMHD